MAGEHIIKSVRVLKIILISLILATVAIGGIRLFSGEDNWICQNGIWIKHGKPSSSKPSTACPGQKIQKEETMELTSPVFFNNKPIPVDYSCRGSGKRPTLAISGIPSDAKSLALTMDDPDAPTGTFHHWLVWNIPVTTSSISGASLPKGTVEGTNSAGMAGYVPPCPPSGTHRYIFTLFALKHTLNLPATIDTKTLQSAMTGHIILQTTLTGTFGK